jgi:ABC-type Na+ efflux pump permease subunit
MEGRDPNYGRDPNGFGWRPVPDPTVLTTQALEREVANLKEMTLREIKGLQDTITTRFSGMDEANTILRERQEKVPSETDNAIQHLREWITEKFNGIAKEFELVESRRVEQKADTKANIDAALTAQKESVGEQNKSNAAASTKMEASFTKQIEQQAETIAANKKSSDEKNDDLKGRLGLIEGRMISGEKGEHRSEVNTQAWVAAAAVTLAVISLGYTMVHSPSVPTPVVGVSPPVQVQPVK